MTRAFLRLAMGSSALNDNLPPDTLRILCDMTSIHGFRRYLEIFEGYKAQKTRTYKLKCRSSTCEVFKTTKRATTLEIQAIILHNPSRGFTISLLAPPLMGGSQPQPGDSHSAPNLWPMKPQHVGHGTPRLTALFSCG